MPIRFLSITNGTLTSINIYTLVRLQDKLIVNYTNLYVKLILLNLPKNFYSFTLHYYSLLIPCFFFSRINVVF